jgi:hypothetical protein
MRKLGITEDEMTSRRDFWKGSLTNQERQIQMMDKHYGEAAAHQREQNKIARGQLALMVDRHGKDSPEYKMAKSKVDAEENYTKGMVDVATMMDKGEDPSKIAAKANDLGMQHQDKMVKVKEQLPDGTIREVIVNPLTERLKPYAAKFATEKTAEARSEYGADTGIQAIPTNSGEIRWRSNRTPSGAQGAMVGYRTLAELVKEEGIKPRKAQRGLSAGATAVNFPYTPSGEPQSGGYSPGGGVTPPGVNAGRYYTGN